MYLWELVHIAMVMALQVSLNLFPRLICKFVRMWSGGSEWVSAYMYVCMYILCMVQSCFKVSSSVRTLHTAITQVSEVL